MNRSRILGAVAVAGALGAGTVAGLFLGTPGLSGAQTPGPTPSSSSSPWPHKAMGHHGPSGRASLDVAARALGMSTADLKTALGNGQSLAAVAKSKNVDVQKVIDALTQDATSRIDAAVKAGKITQAQADTAKQNLPARITAFVNGTRMEKHPGGGFHAGARPSLDVAAKALGMSTADLKTAMGNGQSLAAVAKSKNVDVQKVIDALTQDATSRIDAAVKAGKITQAQADTAKQNLAARITAFVNRTFPAKDRGPGGEPGASGVGFAA